MAGEAAQVRSFPSRELRANYVSGRPRGAPRAETFSPPEQRRCEPVPRTSRGNGDQMPKKLAALCVLVAALESLLASTIRSSSCSTCFSRLRTLSFRDFAALYQLTLSVTHEGD